MLVFWGLGVLLGFALNFWWCFVVAIIVSVVCFGGFFGGFIFFKVVYFRFLLLLFGVGFVVVDVGGFYGFCFVLFCGVFQLVGWFWFWGVFWFYKETATQTHAYIF